MLSTIPHNHMNVQEHSHTPSCYGETGLHFIPGTDRRAVTINIVWTLTSFSDFNSNMQTLTWNLYLNIPTAQIKRSQWKATTKSRVTHKVLALHKLNTYCKTFEINVWKSPNDFDTFRIFTTQNPKVFKIFAYWIIIGRLSCI